jgi:hypothetical protein
MAVLLQRLLTGEILKLPVLTLLLSAEYPATELTQVARDPHSIALGRTQKKTPIPALFCCCGQLPSDSPNITDVFTGWYQATRVPCHDQCTATHYSTVFCDIMTCSPADIFLTFQGNMRSPSSRYNRKCGKGSKYKRGWRIGP